ncbi:glycosyltransferase [Kineococcus sp. NUM-3379]
MIDRCLRTLGVPDPALEVVVVANGCTDDTAGRARRHGVRVVETAVPGKAHALNLGDAACTVFPRAYLDADVELTGADLRAVVAALRSGGALAAAPALHVDLTGAPWAVRAWYRVWTALPYVTHGMVGSGVYVLSAAGRARFDRFPEAIGDDTFVRGAFTPQERLSVPGTRFTVHPPRSLRALVAIKTRAAHGNVEHRAARPAAQDPSRGTGPAAPSSARVLLGSPRLWPSLPVYAAVYALTGVRARLRARTAAPVAWDRDTTSRSPAAR